ncbi:uncharacterized protein LOC113213990 [Frankliniella occidentalis]|uniref:Uncharacterized protein LOC113213990 n=1 Tax=Frankliniella occidentalis TaxID=133901 RepID=A0A6J1TDS4_FRAOC|nr:uncharacterized protein LOC113213990 [Frankliniella occidentalis]
MAHLVGNGLHRGRNRRRSHNLLVYSKMSFIVALALISPLGIHGKVLNNFMGPFIAYTERFSLCESNNQPLPWRWHLRGTHFNPAKPRESQLLTGNITGEKYPLDNKSWAKVVIDVRSNNQWKENGFIFSFKDKACQNFKDHIPTVYELFFKKNETKGECKIEPGVYEVENGPIRWVFPKFPIGFYGHFRFKLMFGMDEIQYACMSVDCKTIPKGVGQE